MKCQFCGKSTTKITAGPNDIALCDECHSAYLKGLEVKDEPKIEVVQEITTGPDATRCELRIGVTMSGKLYFNVAGEGADLLVADGLVKYAERRLKQQWDLRDLETARASKEE